LFIPRGPLVNLLFWREFLLEQAHETGDDLLSFVNLFGKLMVLQLWESHPFTLGLWTQHQTLLLPLDLECDAQKRRFSSFTDIGLPFLLMKPVWDQIYFGRELEPTVTPVALGSPCSASGLVTSRRRFALVEFYEHLG